MTPKWIGRRVIQASVLAIALLLPLRGLAQMVTGLILEEQGLTNQFPVSFVPLTLYDEERGRSAPTYTDRWGRFLFGSVQPGDYTLEIWLQGYRQGMPVIEAITVPEREAIELDPILVDREFSP